MLVCPSLKSNVNLSRIVRLAGCVAVEKVIAEGQGKLDPKIARDGVESVVVERRRSLLPVLRIFVTKDIAWLDWSRRIDPSACFEFEFTRKTALVIGHERHGMTEEQLPLMHDLIEIPVWGLPYSYNVVTATTMAVYEYCRQFPSG